MSRLAFYRFKRRRFVGSASRPKAAIQTRMDGWRALVPSSVLVIAPQSANVVIYRNGRRVEKAALSIGA